MIIFKKIKHLFIGLLFISTFTVFAQTYTNKVIIGTKIEITEKIPTDSAFTQFIKPYKDRIDNDMNEVLAYAPVTFDKSIGTWQTNAGNLFADAVLEMANPVFESRMSKKIDFCLMNNGGIRSIISQGNVTTRTAFEVMPFENSLVILEISGKVVKEMANFILKEKKPHPLSGIEIFVDEKTLTVNKIKINGTEIQDDKTYFVATNDYLSNGGDNMFFLLQATQKIDLDYKLRNLLIDYFKKVDTLPVAENKRIILQ